MKKLFLAFSFIVAFSISQAQTDSITYAEQLGFPKGAKVVIMHVDDVGMSFESNAGAIEAMTKGVANSCSVMMPCAWVPGFVHYWLQHKQVDAGLHLTLTSEWKDYRWVPLSGKYKTPGLVDKEGALWNNVDSVVKNATADEVEMEIRAQIERARSMGFEPTHFDSHMGTLFASPAFLQRYIKLGIEYQIPVMFPGGHATIIKEQSPALGSQLPMMQALGRQLWKAGLPVLDDLHGSSYGWPLPAGSKPAAEELRKLRTKQYIEALQSLKPGVTMVIMHCTQPTEVFPFISDSGPLRTGDLLAMTDPALQAFIKKEGIILTTWRELMERRKKVK